MPWLRSAILLATLLGVGCAGQPAREWMKVNEKYTVEEFRRDHNACRRIGPAYDTCMRDRGWVDMARPAEKAIPDTPTTTTEQGRSIYR